MSDDLAAVAAPPGARYGRSSYRVGEPLPLVLPLPELAAILGVGASQACLLERTDELRKFECLPRVGNKRRYSGKKVQVWADGEGAADESDDTSRRYFGSARKARR